MKLNKIKIFTFGFFLLANTSLWALEKLEKPIKIREKELTFGAFLQFRYTFSDDEDGNPLTTPPIPRINKPATLEIYRNKVYLDGKITYNLTCRFEYDLQRNLMLDAFIKIHHFPYTAGAIIMGQFKVPLCEAAMFLGTPEQLSIKGPLIYEPSVLIKGRNTYSPPEPWMLISDRELGIMIRGELKDKKSTYAFGIFNGNGINSSDDNDIKDRFIQFEVSPWKEDMNSILRPLTIGVASLVGAYSEVSSTGVDSKIRYGFTMKYAGENAQITYEYILQTLNIDGQRNLTTRDWYILITQPYELGFFKTRQNIQTILRYEYYAPNNMVEDAEIKVWTLGINWRINQQMRVLWNYNIYDQVSDEIEDNESLIQLEIHF